MHKSKEMFVDFLMKNDKIYHDCSNRNKIRTRKLISFKQGELCVCPSKSPYWKADLKDKSLKSKERQSTRQYVKKPKQKYGLDAPKCGLQIMLFSM